MIDRIKQVIEIANKDENIRGVFLHGSRVDKDIDEDIYQDYDVDYIVKNVEEFSTDVFKDVSMMFVPSNIYKEIFGNEKLYLMQFSDYSRIDLVVCTYADFKEKHIGKGIMKCLLDKDNRLSELETENNSVNYLKEMSRQQYEDTCAEFFWEIQNMAKGLKRDEISYALFIRDISLRDMLNKMLDTYIGMNNDFKVAVGTLGKYRKKYLPTNIYEKYRNTYCSNTEMDCWNSLFSMISLFDMIAKSVGAKFGYSYPQATKDFVMKYLREVCQM